MREMYSSSEVKVSGSSVEENLDATKSVNVQNHMKNQTIEIATIAASATGKRSSAGSKSAEAVPSLNAKLQSSQRS